MKKLICLLVLAAVLLCGCAREEGAVQAPELMEPIGVKIDTATAEYAELTTREVYEGSIVPQSEEMSFLIDGHIGSIDAHIGQWVEEGDKLMSLNQEYILDQIENLEEEIAYMKQNGVYDDALAELNIDRIELDIAQLEKGSDAQALALRRLDLEQAEQDRRQAQDLRQASLDELAVQLTMLQDEVAKGTLYAPFSGHVVYNDGIRVGTYVQAEKGIVYVVNPYELKLLVPEYISDRVLANSVYHALVEDMRLELEFLPMDENEMMARIFAEQALDTSFTFKGDQEELDRLTAGMYAALWLETTQDEMVLQIPSAAVYSDMGARYVYVITEDGRERRDVKVGGTNGVMTEILSGLEEGEVVYVQD